MATTPDPDTRWERAQAARGRAMRTSRQIAQAAPARQGQRAFRAAIPWDLIHELRAALAELDAVTAEED
jgi:hypothetical protein